jgi:hypothetical protein
MSPIGQMVPTNLMFGSVGNGQIQPKEPGTPSGQNNGRLVASSTKIANI